MATPPASEAARPGWRIGGRRLAFLLVAAALAATAAWLLRDEPRLALRIGVSRQVISSPLQLAIDHGDFAREGLDVTVVSYASGRQALEGLLAGAVDLATMAETPITAAALARRPLRVWATIAEARRTARVVARGDRGIATAADLRGRRVGYAAGTTSQVYLAAFLELHGMTEADVTCVAYAPQDLVDRLVRADVDAASMWEPNASRAIGLLREPVDLHEDFLYRMTWNLASRSDAGPQRDVVEHVLRAIDRANERLGADPERDVEAIARWCELPAARVREMLPDHHFRLQLEGSLVRELEQQVRVIAAPGTPVPDLFALFDGSALRAIQPDAVAIPERLLGPVHAP